MSDHYYPHRTSEGRADVRATVTGRPPKFSNPIELGNMIECYFATCDNYVATVFDKNSGEERQIKRPKPYTMIGLVRYLGFRSRNALLNYEGKEEFAELIIDARLRIEEQRNEQLIEKSGIPGGIIFDLKNNHGWRDETQVEVSGPNGGPMQIGLVGMPPPPKSMGEWEQWYKQSVAEKTSENQEAIDAEFQHVSLPAGGEPTEAVTHEQV